jgi:hypothetical protein
MDMITGIPSHTLLVHLPVIAIPLAAVLVVLFTAIPRWRSVLAYLITGMGVVISAGVVLAASSGESLQETVDKSSLVQCYLSYDG